MSHRAFSVSATLLPCMEILVLPAPAPGQSFVRITDPANPIVTEPATGSFTGAAWIDVDDDGLLNLFMVRSEALFHNEGGGIFTQVDTTPVTAQVTTHTIPTWSGYDLDGDVDLLIGSGSITELRPANLFRNDTPAGNAWINLRLVGGGVPGGPTSRRWERRCG